MSDRRNLVIVTVDCLRADFVTADTMPLTLAMARQGTVYTNAYANGCGTPDSFPAIFASRLARPFAHRAGMAADEEYPLRADDVTLAEVLREAGYQTAAFTAGNPYLGRRYGYHRGFDVYEDHQPSALIDRLTGGRLRGALRAMGSKLLWSPYPGGERVTDDAADWLAARAHSSDADRPIFLWVHYMDAHFPTLPPGRRSLADRRAAWAPVQGDPTEHHELIVDLYRSSLRHVDRQLSRLRDTLRDTVPGESIVVFTADHGQLFGEHGSYWHNGVWEQLLRVPLIVAGPGTEPGSVVEETVQLLDLSPHLLAMLDVEPPSVWAGSRLTAPAEGVYAVSNDPRAKTYAEASIRHDQKAVRTSRGRWTYPRLREPLSLVVA